jgi:predicted SAM-dependent methyltransferase
LEGTGIEIGALHNPMPVDRRRATVRYVDRLPLEEQRRHYPELADHTLVAPDIIADADRLTSLADASQDFVIANHLLEHLPDAIGAMKEWYRVLRPGGILFLALPDKRLTFDKHRPRTTLAHLVADHRDRGEGSRSRHYEEYARLVHNMEGDDAVREAARLMETSYSIHFHVWIPEDIERLIAHLRDAFHVTWNVVHYVDSTGSDEFICVLQRAG